MMTNIAVRIIIRSLLFIASYICANLFLKSFLERDRYLKALVEKRHHNSDTAMEYYRKIFSSAKLFFAHIVTIGIALYICIKINF